MAIDYNSGISSLDTGASDITYSGNQGPKSPQQQQQMMIAQLKQEYEQYKMEQIEIDPSQILSFEEWYQSEYGAARQGVADGGRTGYQGGGADYMPADPEPKGNPTSLEEIENLKEFRIANPDMEDVADYEGYYERLKKLEELKSKGRREYELEKLKRLQEMMRRSEGMTPMSGTMGPPVFGEQDYPQFRPGMPFYMMPELNTGDYAYGGTAHPTYTQKRKQNLAYGGIAGLDGRRQYGLGSWFQEKVMDPIKSTAKKVTGKVADIIPNIFSHSS